MWKNTHPFGGNRRKTPYRRQHQNTNRESSFPFELAFPTPSRRASWQNIPHKTRFVRPLTREIYLFYGAVYSFMMRFALLWHGSFSHDAVCSFVARFISPSPSGVGLAKRPSIPRGLFVYPPRGCARGWLRSSRGSGWGVGDWIGSSKKQQRHPRHILLDSNHATRLKTCAFRLCSRPLGAQGGDVFESGRGKKAKQKPDLLDSNCDKLRTLRLSSAEFQRKFCPLVLPAVGAW